MSDNYFYDTADRWRTILTGEQPDYIHAVNINVSHEAYVSDAGSILLH